MLIKYKNKMITLRDLCIELKINYDNFMSWCHEHALQNYQTALNSKRSKTTLDNKTAPIMGLFYCLIFILSIHKW